MLVSETSDAPEAEPVAQEGNLPFKREDGDDT